MSAFSIFGQLLWGEFKIENLTKEMACFFIREQKIRTFNDGEWEIVFADGPERAAAFRAKSSRYAEHPEDRPEIGRAQRGLEFQPRDDDSRPERR